MPSVANCLKKLGDSINSEDAARVKELTAQYRKDGMTAEEADIEAIDDVTSEARTERKTIEVRIKEAGGVAPTRGKAIVKEAPTPEPTPVTKAVEPTPVEPTPVTKAAEIDAAAAEAQTSPESTLPEPTEAQIESGNYKKGHVSINGINISIENPKGSTRRGIDAQGKAWQTKMKDHYGYIKRTEGADGDQVDVFIGPNVESDTVYVVDQVNPKTGKFDEHKVIIGTKSSKQARAIYARNYAKNWKGLRNVTAMSLDDFKTWLKESDTTKAVKPMDIDTAKDIPAPPKEPVKRKPPPPAEPATFKFEVPEYGFTETSIRKLQDKMRPLLQVQRKIQEARGIEALPDTLDAYRAEERISGQSENDLRKLKEGHVQDHVDAMTKNKIHPNEMKMFLIAMHAEERNIAIAKINPDMPDGGSGMTTEQANNILGAIRSEGRTDAFMTAAQPVWDMLADQRRIIKESGLEVVDVVDSWEEGYAYYVPLKGSGMVDDLDGKPKVQRKGGGLDIRGRETMRALGRRSLAEDPVVHSVIDTTRAILRARENVVGNTFLKLVEQNPNPEYWEVFTASEPDVKRGITIVDGAEVVGWKRMANMSSDEYFATKVNGVEYRIKIKDTRLLKAMKNMGAESMGPVLQALGGVTRFLSSMHTTYNPEFMLTNFSRDIQAATLNVLAEQAIPGGKIKGEALALKMAKSTPRAMRAIHASLYNKKLKGKNAEWQQWYDRFREAGAQTGWFDQKDFEGQAKEISAMLNEAQGGAWNSTKKASRTILDFAHHANTAVENAVRLSVFRHAIEAGVSEAKAASMAKNLTVNFNRKGEIGQLLNTAFMFANASIQGTATFMRAMGTMKTVDKSIPVMGKKRLNPAQKVALGIVGGSFALAAVNREGAGDDEDGVNWYDKVPTYVRERNIVVMKSLFGGEPGAYWTFPLPYAYNIFHVAGDQLESVVSEAKSPIEAAANITASLAGSFSPIGINISEPTAKGVAVGFGIGVTPTVLSPAAQLLANQNFFGSPIYREGNAFGANTPASAMGKPGTAEHWKSVTRWLNEATGGQQFIEGGVDINPDVLKFLGDFIAGGTGAFVIRSTSFAEKFATGREIKPHEVPFARKAMGQVRVFGDIDTFYKRRAEIGQHETQRDSLRSAFERRKFKRENEDLLKMAPRARSTSKKLSHLRKRRQKIIVNRRITEQERDVRLKEVEREIKSAVAKFNKQYNSTIGR